MGKYKERACPGCGDIQERPSGTICYECRDKINKHDAIVEELSAYKNRETVRHGFEGLPPLIKQCRIDHDSKEVQNFRQNLLDLINSLTPVTKDKSGTHVRGEMYRQPSSSVYYSVAVAMSFEAEKNFHLAYLEFSFSLSELLHQSYELGVERGKSLLLQLNSGDISMRDFDPR